MSHHLKCHPFPFEQVWERRKTHEVRVFDRDYRVADELRLYEHDPATEQFTGRMVRARVTAITAPGTYGLPERLGVMSIHLLEVRKLSPEKATSLYLMDQPAPRARHVALSGVCMPGCPACAERS